VDFHTLRIDTLHAEYEALVDLPEFLSMKNLNYEGGKDPVAA
jgi:hypothetical protein